MSNNLYSWHNEAMVSLEMHNIDREIENIRLLRDAGLSNPGWVERSLIALGNLLARLGSNLRQNYTEPHQAYQITTGKMAS